MLQQIGNGDALLYVVGIIIGIIIVTLVLYILVRFMESESKAKDKLIMIIIVAAIAVVVLPIVMSAIQMVLGNIGAIFEQARNAIDNRGANFLPYLAPIIGFLILLIIMKFLIDVDWDNALWISLILLFILYIMFSAIPELYTFFVPLTV